MKLKRKILTTSLVLIIAPLILTALSFFGISYYMLNKNDGTLSFKDLQYTFYTDNATSTEEVDSCYEQLTEGICDCGGQIEDRSYLESLDRELADNASFLLVRKGSSLYYCNVAMDGESLLSILPEYGDSLANNGSTIYNTQLNLLIRQIDFTFSDGDDGSIFILTHYQHLINRKLIVYTFIAIMIIMLLTSALITYWLNRDLVRPIDHLAYAMEQIGEGNLEYELDPTDSQDFSSLYDNYDKMRTRLKEGTEEKLWAQKQNAELVSNITHDLKTPITAIRGYVEGIMDGVADTPEKMDKYIRTIYQKTNEMNTLINELTTYSGIDSNRIPYHFRKINVRAYFDDCAEEIGMDLEAKNISLNYMNLVDPEVTIIADPEQIRRVISNVVSNSIKYMDKPEGHIELSVVEEQDSVRVSLQDNGKGVAQKDLGNIFERFYRTDSSRNSLKGGSGIGLSIAKKIIEDHGGYIWATGAENEGLGIHFVIRKYYGPKMDIYDEKEEQS